MQFPGTPEILASQVVDWVDFASISGAPNRTWRSGRELARRASLLHERRNPRHLGEGHLVDAAVVVADGEAEAGVEAVAFVAGGEVFAVDAVVFEELFRFLFGHADCEVAGLGGGAEILELEGGGLGAGEEDADDLVLAQEVDALVREAPADDLGFGEEGLGDG